MIMSQPKSLLNRIFVKNYPEQNQKADSQPYSFFGNLNRRNSLLVSLTIPFIMIVTQSGQSILVTVVELILVCLWFTPQFVELYLPSPKFGLTSSLMFTFFQLILIEIFLWAFNDNLALYFYVFLVLQLLRIFGNKVGLVSALGLGGFMALQFYFIIGNIIFYWYNLLVWVLIMAVVYNRAVTITQERINRQRTEQLLQELEISHEQLKQYAAQVEQLAATQERNRIARDIHDSLGHLLMAISVQLEKAMIVFPHEPEKAYQTIEESRRLAREALQEVRRSVSTLRSSREETSVIGSDTASFDIGKLYRN